MARTAKDVTEAELSVLRVLWTRGESSVREITDELNQQGNPTQVATAQKLLERLEDKGIVDRDRAGPVLRFKALADRDDLIGRRLRGIAEDLCEGSLTPLLSHLVKNNRLSDGDRKALRDLIDQIGESSTSKRCKKE